MNWSWLVCVLVSASTIMVALGVEAPEGPSARGSVGDTAETTTAESKQSLSSSLLSSCEIVQHWLIRSGLKQGINADGRAIQIGIDACAVGKEEDEDDWKEYYKEYYNDFPDEDYDDFETKRFKTVWRAYVNGLVCLVRLVRRNENILTSAERKGANGSEITERIASECLHGVEILTTAESCDVEGYQFSVVTCLREKGKGFDDDRLTGKGADSPGRYTLEKWIDANSQTGIICPQAFVDNAGVCWRVAGVPVDIEDREGEWNRAVREKKAKYFAFEAAIRTVAVNVTKVTFWRRNGGDGREEFGKKSFKITPLCRVLPSDSSRVKWFNLEKKSITGKRVRMIACAIREDGGRVHDDTKLEGTTKPASQPQITTNTWTSENVIRRKISSRDVVKQQLDRMGVKVGCDAAGGRMVAVATRGYSLKDDEANNANNVFGTTETYDFSDDASDDVETRHFKAMWKAYADCLGTIASYQGLSISEEEEKDDEGNVLSKTTSSAATNLLGGVVFLTMAESLEDGWCEVTVAVGQSKKSEEAYLRGLNGGDAKPGKYTLDEWVKQKSEGCLGIICPQAYCDNEGVWWRIAGAPVNLSARRNLKKVAVLTEKAKHYAYEAAMRTLAVRVSTSTLVSTFNKSNDDGEQKEKIEKTVKIDPINTVLPVDPLQVRWFELDMENPITGNPVRCVVAALRSGNYKNVADEPSNAPAKALARESTTARQITASGTGASSDNLRNERR